jgi:acylphosphatase
MIKIVTKSFDKHSYFRYGLGMKKRLESGISARSVGFGDLSYVKSYAEEFGLTGTVSVKNDGSIKIIAEGEDNNIMEFLKKLEAEEHSFSRVENFYEKWAEPTGEFENFSIHAGK